jgi:DNA segregation ATPase FtsK/SpoIIIE, S-DNA-T family
MAENPKTSTRLLAVVFLGLTLMLWAAVLTYDTADPPNPDAYPWNDPPKNALGSLGARFVSMGRSGLGIGFYYVAVAVTFGLTRVSWTGRATGGLSRLLGLLLSMFGLCVIAHGAGSESSMGPAVGPGGWLGASGAAVLRDTFQQEGVSLIAIVSLGAGIILSFGDLLVHAAKEIIPHIENRLKKFETFVKAIFIPSKKRSTGKVVRETEIDPALLAESDGEPELSSPSTEPNLESTDEITEEKEEPTIRVVGSRGVASSTENDAISDPVEEEPEENVLSDTTSDDEEEELLVRPPRRISDEERASLRSSSEYDVGNDPDFNYDLPSLDMLEESEEICFEDHERSVRRQAKILEKTFLDFGFNVRVVEIQTGPVIAQFEVQLERGLRLSKITGLSDDLAIALKVPSVRIVAPIPGKNTVGIEIPNSMRQLVRLREVMEETLEEGDEMRIPIFLGKDVTGNPLLIDLSTLPHLLIAGRTGTGKSVCLNSVITSILMTRRPDDIRMLLIDPKMVELSPYKSIPHLMHPVVTHMPKAEAILAWAVEKMEERYALLARAGVRHLSVYNELSEEDLHRRMQPITEAVWEHIPRTMPYIVIVADEMADLMMTSAKEVETHIIRLAQKSRAVGIHLVLATQKPTVDIITGLIKSNLPARICFEVASRTDSRVVLDEMGADKLLGNGDLLFLKPGTSSLIRGQGTYVDDDEIESIIESVSVVKPQFVEELVSLEGNAQEANQGGPSDGLPERDPLYGAAVEILIREGRGSVSLLQRNMGVGYGRAARIIDFMQDDGIVGPHNGSQAREILISLDQWEKLQDGDGGSAPASNAKEEPDPEEIASVLKEPEPKKKEPKPKLRVPSFDLIEAGSRKDPQPKSGVGPTPPQGTGSSPDGQPETNQEEDEPKAPPRRKNVTIQLRPIRDIEIDEDELYEDHFSEEEEDSEEDAEGSEYEWEYEEEGEEESEEEPPWDEEGGDE